MKTKGRPGSKNVIDKRGQTDSFMNQLGDTKAGFAELAKYKKKAKTQKPLGVLARKTVNKLNKIDKNKRTVEGYKNSPMKGRMQKTTARGK